MALRGRADDREPEPRTVAVEPFEDTLAVEEMDALPLVFNADEGTVAVSAHRDRHNAAPVSTRVLDEVRQRTLEGRAIARDGDALSINPVRARGARELVQAHVIARRFSRLFT